MTDKCAYCESTNGLEWHHIWPLSLGGPDEPYNMIRVCHDHHGILHSMAARGNISELTKAGLKKAKDSGVSLGPPLTVPPDVLRNMCADKALGNSYDKLATMYDYPRQTIYRNVSKYMDSLDEYETEFVSRQKQYAN